MIVRPSGGGPALNGAITSSFDTFFDQLKAMLPEEFGTEKIGLSINNGVFGKGIPINSLTESDFDSFVDKHLVSGLTPLRWRSRHRIQQRGNPEQSAGAAVDHLETPIGRLGEARDIGGRVALQCSDDARWLTGQRLEATEGLKPVTLNARL